MIIIDNIDNKITIPVGIGVVQTETTRNFYNTADANILPSDILLDKVAYGKYGKVVGNLDLDAEKGTSYTEGYNNGYTIGNEIGYSNGETNGYNNGYNEGVEIGYNDGYSNGESAGYSTGYDEGVVAGYDSGVEIGKGVGRNEIIEEQSDANITPQNVLKGYVGYGKNNERIVGESDAITSVKLADYGMKFQGSSITTIPSIFDLSGYTSMVDMFKDCAKLTSISELDTSKINNLSGAFWGCSSLQHLPFLDTSKVQNLYTTFYGCSKLTTYQEFDLSSLDGTMYNAIYPFYVTDTPINLGGFKDVGKGYINGTKYGDIMIQSQSKLTYESCMNVINKVYDMNLNTQYTNTPKIRFHSTPYALLSADDIAIATSKGWIVQAG